jgi:hypothetical protein
LGYIDTSSSSISIGGEGGGGDGWSGTVSELVGSILSVELEVCVVGTLVCCEMFGFDGGGCDFMTAAYEGTVEIVAGIGIKGTN